MKFSNLAMGALAALSLSIGAASAGPGHGGEAPYGKPGDPKKAARVVPITMKEAEGKMMYFPEKVEVRRGEQIRFVLKNSGQLDHEFVTALLALIHVIDTRSRISSPIV